MNIAPEDLEHLVVLLLSEGVPPGIVGRSLGLDEDFVRDVQRTLRVEKYGTDDLTEYMEQMQWDAVELARSLIKDGSPTERNRMLQAILGRQMAVAARRTPESARKAADNVLSIMDRMRTGTAASGEQSKYVVSVGEDEGA
jgi:hypothetical protein